MKPIFYICLIVVCSVFSRNSTAQVTFLNENNVTGAFAPSGDIFTYLNGALALEAPRLSGKSTFYAGSLWMGGIDDMGQLRFAGQTYRNSILGSYDFSFGPVASNYNTPSYQSRYNRVWKITQQDINTHLSLWNTPNYTVPSVIAEWPANGNTANGEAAQLAPYEDLNNNNLYEPALGEYPKIRGTMAIYLIYNDDSNAANDKLKIEIHTLAYAFDYTDETAIGNTIFLHNRIFNRSANNYQNFYIGVLSRHLPLRYW